MDKRFEELTPNEQFSVLSRKIAENRVLLKDRVKLIVKLKREIRTIKSAVGLINEVELGSLLIVGWKDEIDRRIKDLLLSKIRVYELEELYRLLTAERKVVFINKHQQR